MGEQDRSSFVMKAAGIAVAIVALILVVGTWWMGRAAQGATDSAVRSVSMFYLDELTGRREQVIEANLQDNVQRMRNALSLMTEEDLSDEEHLHAYQTKMKQLYDLDKFAFVDSHGLIYTSQGVQDNVDEYGFNYRTLTGPRITERGLDGGEKTVIISMPLDNIPFQDQRLVACFMEIAMSQMIEGLSLQSDSSETTFCNLYTADGVSLTNMVLGGLASEDNLLDALAIAQYEDGYSYDQVVEDFKKGQAGLVSFTYGGIQETLDYVPVSGTDWMLTYLIRESVISDQVKSINEGLTLRSTLQTLATALVLLVAFVAMIQQTRRSARLTLAKEKLEAEAHVKQEEMEQRLALQEQLLEQEKQRAQQDKMITALASDYRNVYYADLDTDEGIAYQVSETAEDGPKIGEHFAFHEAFKRYAQTYVAEPYQQGFLDFIEPATIRETLAKQPIASYRYLVARGGVESYEMLRMAGVRHMNDRSDGIVHAIGVGMVDVDEETREQMARNQALSDALTVAEEASKAKTSFLSNMSHEIRTPMNAIIGLDSIALADPDLSPKTREQLQKINESARHLLNLINDILDVSRIESGRMAVKSDSFSFSKLIEQVNTIIGGQCAEKGLDYNCRIIGRVGDAYIGDDMKLRQTLINILGNAVKFTPEGGSVDFVIERTAHYEGRSTLRFTIIDTGIGMDASFLPRIFEAFAQEDASAANKYGSTGLGLAITKSIVELMNGSIDVTSEKGKGSTFVVTVTLADAEDVDAHADDEVINPRDLSVLVVDDDPVACEHAKLVLAAVGITAQAAASGEEAVEIVRLRHARRDPFDLILIDWKMPDMDGVETTRRIRAIAGTESAIIILTAYNWDDVLEEAVGAGVDSFIAKPLFATNVLDEFQQAFRRKNASGRAHGPVDLAGHRILLAEDVEINAEIMKQLLGMREMEVEHAQNGREALDMFAQSAQGYYDAILMDMRMPEMDGLSATMAIRALERPDAGQIPIIALTANAFDEDVQQSLQAGLNAHLSKPVEPDVLFETLESFLR